LEAE
jgi:hypothetical protein